MTAPAPPIAVEKTKVSGPLPPFCASEVQSSVSFAVALRPVQLQLEDGFAEQTMETMLFGPAKPTLTEMPVAELTLKFEPSIVPSPPSGAQLTESFAFWALWLVTTASVSARPELAKLKKETKAIAVASGLHAPLVRTARNSKVSLEIVVGMSFSVLL